MPSYTVKSGDTLSGIAARNNVAGGYGSITGYRSGNPNLIFPGEVVSWGAPQAAGPAPAPQASSGPSPAQQAAAEGAAWDKKVNTGFKDLSNFDKNAQNPLDLYKATLESLGITDARANVTGLRTSLLNTENLIKNVEGDVSARTSEALVTENQKRRLVSMEQQPLAERASSEGRNLEVALGDYNMIMNEGKAQTDMQYQFQRDQRAALADRLQTAIGQANNKEDRRRYEKDYERLLKKDALAQEQWEKEFGLEQEKHKLAVSKAAASGGGGSGGSNADRAGYDTARNETVGFLDKYKGGDGFVSPKTFADARRGWTAKGQDPDMFNSLFGGWANPTHEVDYY